ncbi:hypothetical protein [Rhodococcus sp. ACT016]|uniref:hypothetical protein n=1 Tax=Rhodococcus sp. ACT016 TaxID=3134808 RepID=UPI003D2C38F2
MAIRTTPPVHVPTELVVVICVLAVVAVVLFVLEIRSYHAVQRKIKEKNNSDPPDGTSDEPTYREW